MRQKAKKIMTCVCVHVHVPAAGVIFSTVLMKYIFHTGNAAHVLHANAARETQTETRDYMGAHEGKPVSGSQTQMEFWPFNRHN